MNLISLQKIVHSAASFHSGDNVKKIHDIEFVALVIKTLIFPDLVR